MKNWWLNLSYREKQATAVGSLVVALFLIYALIWSPLTNKASSLREKITHNHALLSFMQESDKRITALQNQASAPQASNTSILSIIQTDLNNTSLARGVDQLQEIDSNTVQMRLQKVGFDTFIKWLTSICHNQRLIISQMSVVEAKDPGIVNIELKLQTDNARKS